MNVTIVFYHVLFFSHALQFHCCLVIQLCPTLCDSMNCSTPGFSVLTISQSLLKLMSIESVIPSNHLILCCPLLFLPSIFPIIRVFSNKLALHIMWPKYWSFSISPSNEYSGLTSLGFTGLISLLSKQLSRVFSGTTVWKHQFFGAQPSLWSNPTSIHDYWKNHSFDYMDLCLQSLCFLICCLGWS